MSVHLPSGTPPLIAAAMARIDRRLPHPGEVLVRAGQRVEPDEIVARAYAPGTPQIVNLARQLMVAPSRVERAMRREVGNKVAQGEVLASTGRLGGRTCLAPVGGVIAAVDGETGYVTIVPDPELIELQANVRGIVMEVLPYEGVRIETPAAQVYGVFGVGQERAGVLRLLVTDPSEPILPEMVDARSAYAIIIGGSGITAAALQRAVREQVRGVIVGSIDEAELRAFAGLDAPAQWRAGVRGWRFPSASFEDQLTLVVTEGFGSQPMSSPLFELLASHDRQEALVDGQTQLQAPLRRPRVVIPLSARSAGIQIDPPRPALRPGAMVRVLDHEHLGQVGRVRSVSNAPRRLPSSRARVAAVEVNLDDATTLVLPRAAVEALS
jgi:hypothetical protein